MDIKSFIFLIIFCLLVLCFNPFVEGDALYGFCADSECSKPISRGITIIRYSSPDDSRISFEPNEEVLIYVKEYGAKKDLWGVVVRGNKGYISKNFIREMGLFTKDLVPALNEFRTSVMVTDSYTVSSHLHVSSHPHQPDATSEIVQQMHTVDYHLMSSIPNSVHQQSNFINSAPQEQSFMNSAPSSFQPQDFTNSAPNNFQPPQDFTNSAPNNFQPPQDFTNSAPNNFQPQPDLMNSAQNNFQSQPDFTNSAPNNFQPQSDFMNSATNSFQQSENLMNSPQNNFHQNQDFMNSAPNSHHQEWNSLGASEPYNLPPNINPNLGLPQMHQSSQLSNLPEESSHLHMHSSDLNSYETTGMQSQEVLPSSTHAPGVQPSSREHFSNDPVMPVQENSFSNEPNSLDSGNFNPNVPLPSHGFQDSHQHSFEQLPNIKSPHVQGIHPSLLSNDYVDDDLSRTFAMLSSRGFEGSDMYAGQDPHIQTSSQNSERNFDSSAEEFNSVSSQLQPSSIETSDTILRSSVDPTINENTFINSGNPDKNGDNIMLENVNSVPAEIINTEPSSGIDESVINMVNEDSSKEEIEELDSGENDEYDGKNEEDEINHTSASDESISSTESTNSKENQLNIQSPSSSQINLQSSEGIPNLQSSQKISVHDSDISNTPASEHTEVTQRKQLEISSSKIPSDIDNIPKEIKLSVDAQTALESSMVESIQKTESVDNFAQNTIENELKLTTKDSIVSNTETAHEKKVTIPNTFLEDLSGNLDRNNNEAVTESSIYKKEQTTPKISDFLMENDKRAEVEQIISPLDIDSLGEDLTTYQNRNLKGEYGTTDDPLSDSESNNDENTTHSDSDSYSSYGNWFDALKATIDAIVSWIPEPLYSVLMDLQKKGISPRVPVFTTLCGFTCICLIIPLFYLKDRSKENKLSALLAEAEKKAYTLSATNAVLEEKLESAQTEVSNLQTALTEEKTIYENLKIEFENEADELENAKAELESCLEVIDALKEKENEYLSLINDYEKEKECYAEHKEALDKIMKEHENSIETLTNQLQESESRIEELEKEKEQFLVMKADYEEKLAQFDQSCNQLLQEAEVWNMRVKELTENVNTEVAIKEELMTSLKTKEEEIESLKELVDTFNIFEEIDDPEEQAKSKEEKLQSLLNSAMITNQLKKEEEKSKLLDEQLQQEKNKILEMEVELLEAKSEIDKLKLNYNQALQDKAEAQTKLEVLTNYFKDKEIQLQRQLGAQEADRQKKEDDVTSAERRIMLIEQENISYKSQVASMKQEMEETERTLRSQIVAQEKKAHENWIAARAAERNLENMKQEVTQLRQRLTLLEREQENWANASRDEIIRPVPKRIPGVSEESGNQETAERGMFPPPSLHDRLPLHPMMLPPDRPLPPLPPPMPPMFLPPPPPPMDRHFRPQPWHMPPDHSSDYRTTPPEFIAARESTPPRGRPPTTDGDTAPNTSSPMTTDTRDSRNSTPPHLLPDFHDIPPQPGRPYFPPPMGRPRYPMHPPYRRDGGPEPKRLDNQNEPHSRGPPQPPVVEQWQHSRV